MVEYKSFDDEIDKYMMYSRMRKQAISQARMHRMDIYNASRDIWKFEKELKERIAIYVETGNWLGCQNDYVLIHDLDHVPQEYIHVYDFRDESRHNLRVEEQQKEYLEGLMKNECGYTLYNLFNEI